VTDPTEIAEACRKVNEALARARAKRQASGETDAELNGFGFMGVNVEWSCPWPECHHRQAEIGETGIWSDESLRCDGCNRPLSLEGGVYLENDVTVSGPDSRNWATRDVDVSSLGVELGWRCPWPGCDARQSEVFDEGEVCLEGESCDACEKPITITGSLEVCTDLTVCRGRCLDGWHKRRSHPGAFSRCPSLCGAVWEDAETFDLFPEAELAEGAQ